MNCPRCRNPNRASRPHVRRTVVPGDQSTNTFPQMYADVNCTYRILECRGCGTRFRTLELTEADLHKMIQLGTLYIQPGAKLRP